MATRKAPVLRLPGLAWAKPGSVQALTEQAVPGGARSGSQKSIDETAREVLEGEQVRVFLSWRPIRVRRADDFTGFQHAAVMFRDCRRVIHLTTIDPVLRQETWGRDRLPLWRERGEHGEKLRGPVQIGCGGRVFWQPAEPKDWPRVGYVGLCSYCGWQVFTVDLLRTREERERAVSGAGDDHRAGRAYRQKLVA